MISWKHSYNRLKEEYELAKKKETALNNLFENGKISQSTRDSFQTEIAQAVADIERQQQELINKMQQKTQDLQNQIKTLEMLLANYEIQHVTGEIDENTYTLEIDLLSNGLATAKHELQNIEEATNQLITPTTPEPAPIEQPTVEAAPTEPTAEVPMVEAAPEVAAPEPCINEPEPAPVAMAEPAPAMEEPAAEILEAPVAEEIPAPEVVEAAPEIAEPEPVVEAPATEDMPCVEDPTVIIEEAAPTAQETVTFVDEAAPEEPAAIEEAPAVEQPAIIAEAPVFEETEAAIEEPEIVEENTETMEAAAEPEVAEFEDQTLDQPEDENTELAPEAPIFEEPADLLDEPVIIQEAVVEQPLDEPEIVAEENLEADMPTETIEEAPQAEITAEPEEEYTPEVETLETETLTPETETIVEEIATANPFQEAPEAAQEEAATTEDVAAEDYAEIPPESTMPSVKETASIVENTSEDEGEREE